MRWIALFKESFSLAFFSLIANRLRTLLSLLGVIFGIFVIVLIQASVDALSRDINKTINNLGEDLIFVHKWPWEGDFDLPYWKYMVRPQPSEEEMVWLRRRLDGFADVSYRGISEKPVRFEGRSESAVSIHGVASDFEKVQHVRLEEGRFITPQEIRTGSQVVVVGHNVAANLLKPTGGIGSELRVGPRKVTVIGILRKKGESLFDFGEDDRIFIPYGLFSTMVAGNPFYSHREIMVKPLPGVPKARVRDEIIGAMRSLRKLKPVEEDDFSLNETSMLTKQTASISGVLSVVGWVVGGLSILVGAFGVANIMFVSVQERTGQIGIQKALGATRPFILLQFLNESVLLTLLGGGLGILFVALVGWVVRQVSSFDLVLASSHVLYGMVVSTLVGLIAGISPAWAAARMNPVDAIRAGI
jgi:putative ABC transport system permease protein